MANKALVYSIMGPIENLLRGESTNWDEKFGIHFTKPELHERFDDYDPLIIVGDTLTSFERKWGQYKATVEATRIEREIFNSLESGKIVCLLCDIDKLFARVFERIKVRYNIWDDPKVDLIIRQSEFQTLLKRFGSTKYDWLGSFERIIAETDDGKTVGFSKKVDNGNLLYLPCYMPMNDFIKIKIVSEFIPCLLESIEKYRPRIQYEPPNWLNSYYFSKEAPIISEIEGFQKEIDNRKERLKSYSRLKEVLWLRDNELVDSIINMFKVLGIETKKDEIYEEDFWITESNVESIIVEVKGLNKNVTRIHINKLENHREARGKPDDFPTLLSVNTFNNAQTVDEKDQAISPNEIKRAVRNNILIIRTIDLCNAYSLIQENKLTSEQLLELIKTETGWLKITDSDCNVLKK